MKTNSMNARRNFEHDRPRMRVKLAKLAMKARRSALPTPRDVSLNEIFRHESYVDASPSEQRDIRHRSSVFRYEDELRKPFFQTYFPGVDPKPLLRNKRVLDFGCFTGGRAVRWAEEYGIGVISGSDINPIYLQAATEFAASKNINSDFRLIGEDNSLPFEDESMDAIVSFDVFEHVNNLTESLRQCKRVLKRDGVMFLVFPSFYQPLESHLDLVTKTPALQWFFDGRTLTKAYFEILSEQEDTWYTPLPSSSTWERLPTLNGVTASAFYDVVESLSLSVERVTRTPILTTGASYYYARRYLVRPFLATLLRTGMMDDYILDRIAVMLRKSER